MPRGLNTMTNKYCDIVNRRQFQPIPDMQAWYPDLGFSGCSQLITTRDPIFVTDPIYLADVYNQNDDPVAAYIRSTGVIVNDFGGDTSCPVWWRDPFLVLSTSAHVDGEAIACPPCGTIVLANQVGCDSASFVFLVMQSDLPDEVLKRIETVLRDRNGALLDVPMGAYSFWLEQIGGYSQANLAGLYRNIVAERTPLYKQ